MRTAQGRGVEDQMVPETFSIVYSMSLEAKGAWTAKRLSSDAVKFHNGHAMHRHGTVVRGWPRLGDS